MNTKSIAKAVRKVGDWQLARLPAEAETDWTFAALYTGFMAVPRQVAGQRYRQAMLEVGRNAHWQLGPRVLHADDLAVGQTYLDLYRIYKDDAMLNPTKERIEIEMDAREDPHRPLWWWCDALFMAPPAFARLSAVTGDPRYVEFMDRQWMATSNLLYDDREHLFSRDASYLSKRELNGKKVFWSRGNGWVMAGIVRILEELPLSSPLRGRYEQRLQDMAAEMLLLQGSDGLWRAGLLDEKDYDLPEISGSAFITYAVAYGVRAGILNRATYLPLLQRSWRGMMAHIYSDGRLGSIQPVGAAPGPFTSTSSYVYGVGAYLLAGSELYLLAKSGSR